MILNQLFSMSFRLIERCIFKQGEKMNINLRISTDPITNSGKGCQHEPSIPPDTNKLTGNLTNSPTTSANAASSPQQDMGETTSKQSVLPNSEINIQNQISTGSTPIEQKNINATSSENKNNEEWAKSLVTEMKGMFDSFLTSLTKLLESIFGAKSTNPVPQNPTPVSQGNSQNQQSNSTSGTSMSAAPINSNASTSNPGRVVESFIAHTAKTLGPELASVNEEKMRESVIMYQLYQKDEEAENVFRAALAQNKSAGKSSDAAIKAALIETEKANKIQRWESDWVYSLSFQAAQLDNDLNNVSGALANLPAAAAIQTAERNLIAIATGASTPLQRSVAA